MKLKAIPGTLCYQASECGKIFLPTGDEATYYRNGDGYITASVKTTDGKQVTFGVHRLVALAHVPCDFPVESLTVNHRDHDITNNHKSNLEWVTGAINIIHAALHRLDRVTPSVIARSCRGDRLVCLNIQSASEVTGIPGPDIWDCIKNKTSRNGWSFDRLGRGVRIPPDLVSDNMSERDKEGKFSKKAIVVTHVLSGRRLEFPSFHEGASYFDVSASHLYQCLADPQRPKLFQKKYLVTYLSDELPEYSEEDLKDAMGRGAKPVLATNLTSGEVVEFPSAARFVEETGLSKKAVTTRLRQGRVGPVGNWQFRYK